MQMVCLPGLLCTSRVYDGLRKHLGAVDARVLSLPDGDDFEALSSELSAQIPDGALLVGLSMGSYLALDIARRAPERLSGLVLIGCTPAADSEKAAAMRGKVAAWAQREGIAALATSICDSMLGKAQGDDPALRATVAEMAEHIGLETFARHQSALAGRRDNTAAMSNLSCPVLTLTGNEDTVTPPELGRSIAQAVPHGRFAEIPGAGHLCVLERPDLVAAEIERFIAETVPSATVAQ